MSSYFTGVLLLVAFAVSLACSTVSSSTRTDDVVSGTAVEPAAKAVAVFAGGCFWGVEAVFEHVKGVSNVKSGYAGGNAKNANYDAVGSGETGHAESVQVTYDPAKVSYEQLLEVFFKVVHDPTELNRQGPDEGPQYRSAIFYTDDAQKQAAAKEIEKLNAEKLFSKPIVTEITPLDKFYDAEAYHQDYLARNPKDPYIVYHDLPKLENLKKQFPALYFQK